MMEINFDNLRKQLAKNYNELVRKLNEDILRDDNGQIDYDVSLGLYIGDIKEEMDGLRNTIASFLALASDKEKFNWLDIPLQAFAEESD